MGCLTYLDDTVPEKQICFDFILQFNVVFVFPQSLFWENNQFLVTSYADNTRRFMPLQDVLYGRTGDLLSWCRQKNASGKTPAQITRKIKSSRLLCICHLG